MRYCAGDEFCHTQLPSKWAFRENLRERFGPSLAKTGLCVQQQHPLNVYDEDGTVLGKYFADLFVERRLIVELKATRTVSDEHVAQVLGYLKSSRIETGLLINFGNPRIHVKKYLMTP